MANNREMPPLPSKASEESEAVPPKKGIEVIALRPGFFQQQRKVEGDKFTVVDMSKVGTWMKCVDPVLEKQHQSKMKEQKSVAGN
jgi:hypothetical protein